MAWSHDNFHLRPQQTELCSTLHAIFIPRLTRLLKESALLSFNSSMATAPISTDSHKFALPHSTLEHAPYQAPQHNSFQPSYATDKVTDDPGTSLTKQTRNPWGLSPLAFGLLIAAISAVIVGAAVGGGVGGALSSNTKSVSHSLLTIHPRLLQHVLTN